MADAVERKGPAETTGDQRDGVELEEELQNWLELRKLVLSYFVILRVYCC